MGERPTADNLLVFYLPEAAEWQVAVQRMQAAGFAPGPSYNPYWDKLGRTFEDPDRLPRSTANGRVEPVASVISD